MSLFFPRFQEISPLFRLADELDRATRTGGHCSNRNLRSFAPRFDVKETKEAYELHGELPGLEQSQINIEWSDEKTLTISGRTDRSNEYANAAEADDFVEVSEASDDSSEKAGYKKPTVEEDGAEQESAEVAKTEQEPAVAKTDENAPKYWITERSIGSFNRTFRFPLYVDQDSVQAKLKNGVLSITVPKSKPKEPRRIEIS